MDTITNEQLKAYAAHLRAEEREASTIDKYARDLREFSAWLEARELDKEAASQWKVYLLDNGLAPVTVNGKLAALNGFLRFLGREDCRVRALKVQRRVFREQRRELDRAEYVRLVETARREGRERLALLLETICATGIRVSELRFVTVEAARVGRADVSLKGKIRTILLPKKLCRKLLKYAGARKIASGAIFRARGGEPISRKRVYYIWFGETRDLDEVMEGALSESSVDWHAEDFVMLAEQDAAMRGDSVEKLAEAYREQAYGGRKTNSFPKSNVFMLFTTYRGLEYIKNERKLAGLTVGKIYRMLLKNGIPCTCAA